MIGAVLVAKSKSDAEAKIVALADECAKGVSDREGEAKALAEMWCLDVDVGQLFDAARTARDAARITIEDKAEPTGRAATVWRRPLWL